MSVCKTPSSLGKVLTCVITRALRNNRDVLTTTSVRDTALWWWWRFERPRGGFLVDGIYKHISGDLPIALSMVSYSQMEVFRTLAEPVLARCSRETRKPRETLLSLNIAARHDYFYAISPTMVFICSDKNVGFLGSFRFEWIKSSGALRAHFPHSKRQPS